MKLNHPPTSTWNDCPADILYPIFKGLSSAELHRLCLVNGHFRTIAEPLLYSEIQFTWQRNHDFYSDLEPPPPITQLLRTLLSRPQLATYIKSLRLDGQAHDLYATRFKLPRIHIPEAELDEAIAFISRTGVPYADRWIQGLRDGTIDALVALFLAQLQSLRYLYIGRAFTRQSALIGMVLQSAICEAGTCNNLPDFQHIKEVSFFHREDRDEGCDRSTRNSADILPVFYLPNIQHLSVSIQNPDEWKWPSKHPPTPGTLTSLDLTNIREGHLGDVLAVTRNLEKLSWRWYYDEGVKDKFTTQTIELDQIAAAISHVQETLTDLTITADCAVAFAIGGQFLPGLKTEGSLKAMANFSMIKKLQIPWAFLVGFAQDTSKRLQDVVPRNIESLTMTDDLDLQNRDYMEPQWPAWEWEYHAILDLLELWLKEWTIYTPRLRYATLLLSWIDTDTDEWPPDRRDQFTALGSQYGVSLELVEVDW